MCCHANGIMFIVPLTAEHVQYHKRKLVLVAEKINVQYTCTCNPNTCTYTYPPNTCTCNPNTCTCNPNTCTYHVHISP